MAARARIILILFAVGIILALFIVPNLPRPAPTPRELFPYGEMRIAIDASNPPFAALKSTSAKRWPITLASRRASST
jgi:hypothetical protein